MASVTGVFGFATAGTGDNGPTVSLNPSSEIVGQANRRLVLGISFYDGFGPGTGVVVEDNGPDLDWVEDQRNGADPEWDELAVSMLYSAPFESGVLTTDDTIVVTYGQNSYVRSICGLILDDADTVVSVDARGSGGGLGQTLDADLDVTVNSCIVGFGWEDAGLGVMTPLSGYTERFDYQHTADNCTFSMVTKEVTPGSYSPGATCSAGTRFVYSSVAYRDKNAPVPPINLLAPEITGIAQVGQTIECSSGEWLGDEPLSYAYQWMLDGDPIVGATTNEYEIDPADEGLQLWCVVTASNDTASVTATSNSTVAYATGPYDVLVRKSGIWEPSTWRRREAGDWVPPIE